MTAQSVIHYTYTVTLTVARLRLLAKQLLRLPGVPSRLVLEVEGRGAAHEDVSGCDDKQLDQLGVDVVARLVCS